MELDYTQANTCVTCPMKWHLKFVRKLHKRAMDERDIDRLFGSTVHKCLEAYYRYGNRDFITMWEDFQDLPGEVTKTKENGIKLCNEYITNYVTQDSGIKLLDVEVIDRVKLSDNLTWIVKIDSIIKHKENIYVLEHKTTSKLGPQYFNQYNPNMQISGYTYYAERRYGQCSGSIINVLCVGFRQRAYKGEPAGFHCKFQREIVNRDSRQLIDFKDNVIKIADKIQEFQDNPSKIYKNESACHQFRGCPYKEICLTSHGIELDEEIVNVLYEDTKDPLDYLQKGDSNGDGEDAVLSSNG